MQALFKVIVLPAVIFAGLYVYSSAPGPDRQALPNVVLIVTDDQGWGDLSYNGNTNLRTPHIDGLAEQGASFDNFYVSAVCSPTRAELMTGRYHPRSGVSGTSAGEERMDLDETTLAEVFSRAGYATGIFGKWHNGMQYPYHPNGRGFDEFYGFASGHWGDYFSPALLEHNGRLTHGEGYITDDFTEKALTFIEEHKDRPFFAYLPYNIPHSPMQVPDRWWNRFKDKELLMRHRDPEKEDPAFTRAALAMVENIDWNVGRLMQKLEELDLDENTIVIFMSDNGPNSWRWNGGMKGRKGSVDEGGLRSPLFIRWPGEIQPARQIEQPAAAIDLLPTLAELAGIPYETNNPLDGISLEPLLTGKDTRWDDRLLYSHWNGNTSVRSDLYRLDGEGRLYDISRDRGQENDLSAQYRETADALADSLKRWEERVLGELPGEPRPFPVGHPDFRYTQLPARDATPHGHIRRSNRFPNDSFFTGWTSTRDSISWEVKVLEEGSYRVELYYTCAEEDVGSTVELSFGSDSVAGKVNRVHDPPLRGMEDDRVERIESYVKDFRPMQLGVIDLKPGQGPLTLRAPEVAGDQVMDFRTLMLTRVDE